MKKTSNVGYILRLSLTLLVICAVVAVLLAEVNAITAPRITASKQEKTAQAVAAVLPDGETAAALDTYPDESGIIQAVYASETGYAIQVAPSGFDSQINMMVGVSKDGRVLGVSIISHTETAGLGAVAAAKTEKGQAFRDQFVGKSGVLAVSKDGGDIDAITSATITSRAVTSGVNAALQCAERLG
ncbi:MAG TPA: RnfABCDGE type electron transport complex subunit G [Candidatus Faecousia intestinigallinarum]|nr:RnfABCDGE type electron transport complex subunit G [Candidatus Faecousia intestinigallinarum]